jgi:hypothetical protein
MNANERARARETARATAAKVRDYVRRSDDVIDSIALAITDLAYAVDLLADVSEAQERAISTGLPL